MFSFSGEGVALDQLNRSLIAMWTQEAIHPLHFYRTGFEAIFFKKSSLQALDCVLSSAIPNGKGMVITGKKHLEEIGKRAADMEISTFIFEANPHEIPLMNTLLPISNEVSHLLLVVDDDNDPVEEYINYLSPILRKENIELILYCREPIQKVKERTNEMVDFMIGGWNNFPDHSFVVARRSKLVQTEGNARVYEHDLHALWQWSLRNRESNIAPVEM